MKIKSSFLYHFYPVGQGLFSTGSIYLLADREAEFRWVYDCGTTTAGNHIEDAINKLEHGIGKRKRIDLLILSHFDKDHISGVSLLLEKFEIGTLLLPYLTLEQRLVLIFEQGVGTDDPLITFYINPVEYLLQQEGPGINRILFVPASGEQGSPPSEDIPNPQEPTLDASPDIGFQSEELSESEDQKWMEQTAEKGNNGTSVDFLRSGSGLQVAAYDWEFIPYNEDLKESIPPKFIRDVIAERHSLLAASTPGTRNSSLDKLKKIYDRQFGSTSKRRNVISLFLYSGPNYSNKYAYQIEEGLSLETRSTWHKYRSRYLNIDWWIPRGPLRNSPNNRCSILYSGDGYLNTNARLQKLTDFLGKQRVQRIGVFQVMHHGARANWHEGIAAAIAPLFSVFSSDPDRNRGHPHAPVLRDFWQFGAVQVDKTSDFTAYGIKEIR